LLIEFYITLRAVFKKGILSKRDGRLTLEGYTDAKSTGSLVDIRSTTAHCTFPRWDLVT